MNFKLVSVKVELTLLNCEWQLCGKVLQDFPSSDLILHTIYIYIYIYIYIVYVKCISYEICSKEDPKQNSVESQRSLSLYYRLVPKRIYTMTR